MITAGFKLTIIGMFVVYAFLYLLVLLIHLSTRLLRPYTEQEEKMQALRRRKSSVNALMKDNRLPAVISAAVSAHRKRTRK